MSRAKPKPKPRVGPGPEAPTPDGPKVEVVPIDALLPDAANVRLRDEEAERMLASSVRQFGPARSIVLDGKDVVKAGNGALKAAREAGVSEVLVVEPKPGQLVAVKRSDWTPSQATAYAIADNQLATRATWDEAGLSEQLHSLREEGFDFEPMGFTLDEASEYLSGDEGGSGGGAEDPGAQVDRAEELQKKWGTESAQLWVVPSLATPGGEHRLLVGDSTRPDDVARVMQGEKASLVVTDPPYGVNFVRGQFISNPERNKSTAPKSIVGDDRKGDEQREFIRATFENLEAHVEPGTPVYMFSASMVEGCCSFFGMIDAGLHVQSQLVWNKSHFVMGQADHHWKHELCWYGWYPGGAHPWYGGRDKSTVIDAKKPAATFHPNEKPAELYCGFIANSSLAGDVLLEPFGGSGTAIAASEATGRLCRAVELDPKYAACILERLALMGLEPRLAG